MSSSTTSSTLELTQNPCSVYFLHPADSTSQQLVNTIFDGEGYTDWKRMMIIGLSSKNRMSFVDGTLPKPSGEKEAKAWDRADNMVCGWILKSLGPNMVKSVLHLPTARAIWQDIEERFGHSYVAQLFSYRNLLI